MLTFMHVDDDGNAVAVCFLSGEEQKRAGCNTLISQSDGSFVPGDLGQAQPVDHEEVMCEVLLASQRHEVAVINC